MTAIGATVDIHHYAHCHPIATAGTVGAMAARSCASGTGEVILANACETGTSASRFARMGGTRPMTVLAGPQDLYFATGSGRKPMAFPDQWRTCTPGAKPWAACCPAIDCAPELRAQGKPEAPLTPEPAAAKQALCRALAGACDPGLFDHPLAYVTDPQ
jgi:hypothetical protein